MHFLNDAEAVCDRKLHAYINNNIYFFLYLTNKITVTLKKLLYNPRPKRARAALR